MPRSTKDNGTRHGWSPDMGIRYKELTCTSQRLHCQKGGGKKLVAQTRAANAAARGGK